MSEDFSKSLPKEKSANDEPELKIDPWREVDRWAAKNGLPDWYKNVSRKELWKFLRRKR